MEKKEKSLRQQQTQQDPFKLLLNKRIVLQISTTTVEGDLIYYDSKWLVLQNAVIIGTKHRAETPLFITSPSKIHFAHLLATKLEKLSEKS